MCYVNDSYLSVPIYTGSAVLLEPYEVEARDNGCHVCHSFPAYIEVQTVQGGIVIVCEACFKKNSFGSGAMHGE